MMKEEEIWKDVPGYNGSYQVSSLARVRSVTRIIRHGNHKRTSFGAILIQSLTKWGYSSVGLSKDRKQKIHRVHRLVATAFIPNPENKREVNHKNGIKTDNRIENLEWTTTSENALHAFSLGLRVVKGGRHHHSSRPILRYDLEGNFIDRFDCIKEPCKKYGYDDSNLSSACKKKIKTAYGFIWEYEP